MTSSVSLARPSSPSWRRGWRALHAPVPGVPRWARIAALVVPLTVLPSSVWRVAGITFHLPIVDGASGPDARGNLPAWLPLGVYVVLLSIVSELLAFTAVGLVARWGEVVPRWVPVAGGRPVPARAAVVPAAVGATFLTLLWTWTMVMVAFGRDVRGRPHTADFPLGTQDLQGWLALAAYVPLVAWGPLLGALTIAYARRRASLVPRG
ncbi:hypothetical protein ACFT5B_11195 [Luteimicrobium sp. NPDC057192]|uniref:hypothetical protein n=1 Tax=Luteimicrobium sp. NPDC057192 TaxID=3346042 RepID=UPI0036252526